LQTDHTIIKRKTFHKHSMYGKIRESDGKLLGDHDSTGDKPFLKPDNLRPEASSKIRVYTVDIGLLSGGLFHSINTYQQTQRKVSMTVERWQLRVSGKVQGVSYRAYTEQKAGELGLTGTVKNLPGGDVEIIAEGTPDDLEALQDWCRNGPPQAMVENVSTETQAPTGEFNDFRVVY